MIEFGDFLVVSNNFGKSFEGTFAVPEPNCDARVLVAALDNSAIEEEERQPART